MKHNNEAWAVRITEASPLTNRIYFAGRYYFGQPEPPHAGCLVSLFETRHEARTAAKHIDDKPNKFSAVAVRVVVEVKEVKP